MKKIVRIFTLLVITLCLFTFTGCTNTKNGFNEFDLTKATVEDKKDDANYQQFGYVKNDVKTISADTVIYLNSKEENTTPVYVEKKLFDGEVILGLLEGEDKLYLNGYNKGLTLKDVKVITVKPENKKGDIVFPKIAKDGYTFSGWYTNEECTFGNRVANFGEQEESTVLYSRFITFGESCIVTVICVLIVFLMLALLWGLTTLIKFVNKKEKEQPKEEPKQVVNETKQTIKLEDITDEDMMVAALVSTIDYHNETKQDVRVVSIKEIK